MKIGAMDGVLRTPWEKVFDEAARLGFDGVELGVRSNYRESELWKVSGRQMLAKYAKTSGVELPSICLHSFWEYSFANPDPRARATAREILTDALRFCDKLGVKVVLVPVTNPAKVGDEEASARWVEELKVCAPTANEYGVYIALENVGRSHVQCGRDLLALIQAVDEPFVEAYYDVGNGESLGGDPIEDLHLLADHLAQVHVKDPGGSLLGHGRVNLRGCVDALKAIGYDGYLMLETPATDNPATAAAHNLKYLRDLIG